MAATVVQIACACTMARSAEPCSGSAWVIVVYGAIRCWRTARHSSKWKPTVLYWLMGGALLVGQLVLRKT